MRRHHYRWRVCGIPPIPHSLRAAWERPARLPSCRLRQATHASTAGGSWAQPRAPAARCPHRMEMPPASLRGCGHGQSMRCDCSAARHIKCRSGSVVAPLPPGAAATAVRPTGPLGRASADPTGPTSSGKTRLHVGRLDSVEPALNSCRRSCKRADKGGDVHAAPLGRQCRPNPSCRGCAGVRRSWGKARPAAARCRTGCKRHVQSCTSAQGAMEAAQPQQARGRPPPTAARQGVSQGAAPHMVHAAGHSRTRSAR